MLAAQYESWLVPVAVMLTGLASKNAILIVEFAKERRERGAAIHEAAREAARLRFRPILMTSLRSSSAHCR